MCSSYWGELAIILGVKGLRFSDYQFNISEAFLKHFLTFLISLDQSVSLRLLVAL